MNASTALTYPFPTAPAFGKTIEVAPGILWARIPLPFRLDHVNIYLIDDGDGWAVLDTGLANNVTREAWEALIAGPLSGRKLTRLIVTHFHPDHIGLAGWLTERCGIPLLTSENAFLQCQNIALNPGALNVEPYISFYLQHGLEEATTGLVSTRGHEYLKLISGLPPTFKRLVGGDTLRIGGRSFAVLTGDGHAPDQLMFYCADDKLFFAADQVLAKITPNISVWAVDPEGNPLGLYMRSLTGLKSALPDDVLVLPGHQLPFYGLHRRVDELVDHHAQRCAAIAEACATAKSVAELVPVVFRPGLDPHQMGFAFSEVLAHVNYMLERRELVWAETRGKVRQVIRA